MADRTKYFINIRYSLFDASVWRSVTGGKQYKCSGVTDSDKVVSSITKQIMQIKQNSKRGTNKTCGNTHGKSSL